MPMRGELRTPERQQRPASTGDGVWPQFVAAITNPEFVILLCFGGLGLSITICFMQFVPDYGSIVEALGP
jgi:hypothetical protein